jgi:hypothetical protein
MAVLLVGLPACDGVPDSRPEERASREISVAAAELDAIARESGALPDGDRSDPAGRYGRRHESGSDSLCLVPDGKLPDHYRFGLESRIGQEYCRGSGRASRSRDKLLLRFEGRGDDCLVVARYEGDRVLMPGALDLRCTALCSARGSLAGVRFPRMDRDAAAAKAMQDSAKQPLCR